MDAAHPYVDGDDTADEQFFAGTIPNSLLEVERFFPFVMASQTPAFPVSLQNSVHPITGLRSPPIAVFSKSLSRSCSFQRLETR